MVRPRRLVLSGLLGCSCLALSAGLAAAEDAIVLEAVTLEGGTAGDAGVGTGGGLATEGYVAKAARVGTKTDTDLKKVPQSIAVVSREELEARQVQSLVEAVAYTSGVRVGTYGFDPRFDTVFLRGFNVTGNGFYRDGLRSLGGTFSVLRLEPYGLDGISILKGPSSVLYGAGPPGGIVNVVSKRPTEAPFREVEAQIGSNKRYQGNFDASGPLGGNDNVLYRLTGIARSADTELIAARDDRTYIAPALTLRSTDRNTHLTILGEYTELTSGGAAGYVTLNNRITDIEEGDPRYRDLDVRQARIGYEFEHRFDETVTIRQNLRYQSVDTNMRFVSFTGVNPDGITASRSAGQILDDADSIAVDNQVQVNVSTGPVAHTLLGGLDYSHTDSSYRYGANSDVPSLNLLTRNYGAQPIEGPTADEFFSSTNTQQSLTGVYLQDQAEYNRFVLTLGGRYDWLNTRNESFIAPLSRSEQDDEQFSGRAGLSYLFDNGISPYVSYSTSFAPTIGTNAAGLAFDPTEGDQVELGVKYAPDDMNLSVNAALFEINQTNVLSQDPDNRFFQIQLGEVQSRGFEVSATTSLAEGIDLTAAYTYVDLEITGGDNLGKVPVGIPAHQFSVWGGYQLPANLAEGLGLGLGVRFQGQSFADSANTRENDDRVFVDASLSYDFGKANPQLDGISAQINAKNLFDKRDVTCADAYCYREQGRDIIGSIKYRF